MKPGLDFLQLNPQRVLGLGRALALGIWLSCSTAEVRREEACPCESSYGRN